MDLTLYSFVDTETDGLAPARLPWEIAVYQWSTSIDDWASWLIHIEDFDASNVSPDVDAINHFRDRWRKRDLPGQEALIVTPRAAAVGMLRNILAGKMIVGSAPDFDRDTLRNMGVPPVWHHRMRDVPTMFLGRYGYDAGGLQACADAMGVDRSLYPEHTALGDARLARDLFIQITKEARHG